MGVSYRIKEPTRDKTGPTVSPGEPVFLDSLRRIIILYGLFTDLRFLRKSLFAAQKMFLLEDNHCPFAQSFCCVPVSVIRVREFRARGSNPVICHLDFELSIFNQ